MYDFKEFFSTYFKNASEKPAFVEAFGKRIVNQTLPDPLIITDIGCHDGTLTLKIIQKLREHFKGRIKVIAVEPSLPALERFASLEKPEGTEFEFIHATAEEFYQNPKFGKQHSHWTLASHCLYWSPNLETILTAITQNSDHAVIILRGEKGIYPIQKQFSAYLGNSAEKLYNSKDIARTLGPIREFQEEAIESLIQIPQFNEITFKYLVAFFLQITPDQLSDSLLKEVEEFIPMNDKRQLTHHVSFFWVG